jgi:hypothetical protein
VLSHEVVSNIHVLAPLVRHCICRKLDCALIIFVYSDAFRRQSKVLGDS